MTERNLRPPTINPTHVVPLGYMATEAIGVLTNTQVEDNPVPTYATVEDRIAALEVKANTTGANIRTIYDASSDTVKQEIDRLEDNYSASVSETAEEGREQLSFADFLSVAKHIPPEFKTAIREYEATILEIEAAENELEKYAPEKAVEVLKKAIELEKSLDYDKVVARSYADEDDTIHFEGSRLSSMNLLYDVSRVIGVRKLLESRVPLTYYQLKSIEQSLNTTAAEYAEKGLLKEQAGDIVEAVQVLTEEQVTDLEAHIKGVCELRMKYKKFDEILERKTQAVLSVIRQIKEHDDGVPTNLDELFTRAEIIYNDDLDAAVNRRLAQKLGELPASEFEADIESETYLRLIEHARGIDATEALKKLEVGGSFKNLPFEFSEAELKLFLLTSVPAAALASVKRIEFRSMTQEEDEEDDALGLNRWSDELGGSEIIISDVKVYKGYQNILEQFGDNPEAKQFARNIARNRMLQTITHEFGHGLHGVLPIAALKRWEEQRALDPTNITEYVKSRHDSNHRHRYMEDFADTMALFINNPGLLEAISPTRFNAMRQIFEEIMPLYVEVMKNLQDRLIAVDRTDRMNRGMPDETVKLAYLTHKTA